MPDNGNGHDAEYNALLRELDEKGLLPKAEELNNEGGLGLLALNNPQFRSNASLLASIPEVEKYFSKAEKKKALILDQLARAKIKNLKQLVWFNKWVQWCEQFKAGDDKYDQCLYYLVGSTSEGGLSREQFKDAITSLRMYNHGNYNRKPDQQKSPDRGLS